MEEGKEEGSAYSMVICETLPPLSAPHFVLDGSGNILQLYGKKIR